MSKSFEQRLKIALRHAGKTASERSVRIGRTTRAIGDWEKGKGIAPILKRLEDVGVIRILDEDEDKEKTEVYFHMNHTGPLLPLEI